MDLDSWKPEDIYRRISIAVSVQLSLIVGCAAVLALGWHWLLGILITVLVMAALHGGSMRIYARRRRRR